jgi:hypothetical protein
MACPYDSCELAAGASLGPQFWIVPDQENAVLIWVWRTSPFFADGPYWWPPSRRFSMASCLSSKDSNPYLGVCSPPGRSVSRRQPVNLDAARPAALRGSLGGVSVFKLCMNTQLSPRGTSSVWSACISAKVGFLIAVIGPVGVGPRRPRRPAAEMPRAPRAGLPVPLRQAIDCFRGSGSHDQRKFSTSIRFSARLSSWEYSSQRPSAETSR